MKSLHLSCSFRPFLAASAALLSLCCAGLDAQQLNLDSEAASVSRPVIGRGVRIAPIGSQTSVEPTRRLTLEPMTEEEGRVRSLLVRENLRSKLPENFREMGTVQAHQVVDTKTLTLRFASSAKITKIEGTPDFKVEQGGSCVEGYSYAAHETCTLLVRFTPQGGGRRTGRIAVESTADAKPLYVGIGGYGSAPSLTFTPSVISTVPQTINGTAGVISGAHNLTVDGGDGVYIADTANKQVRYYNPNASTLSNITFGFTITDPQGIAVDAFDFVYISQDSPASFMLGTPYGSSTLYSSGSGTCSYGSTCNLGGSQMSYAGAIATDPNGTMFLSVYTAAYELISSTSGLTYQTLSDGFNYNDSAPFTPGAIAVDSSDNIYGFEYYLGNCFISANPLYYAATGTYGHYKMVAGGRSCGFSGDGAQARSAQIGSKIGQMTFDIAGNFYFSDTTNNRVRRIDASTGIITTIAGSGVAGYSGDGGMSTTAQLNAPTGVTVDSQGQVYILSSATTGQVMRKVSMIGALNEGSVAVGSTKIQTIQLANTGNAPLNFAHEGYSSGSSGDFPIDPNTTNCDFTVPLAAGHSCKIGFIFKPSAVGLRSAVYSITDDTIAGVNTIQLSGTGYPAATLTPASMAFANTNVGSASAAQTATLTNTSTAAMTISSIAFSGTGATSYTDTTNCGATLAAGASCTISITFKPASAASLPATLTVTDNAINGHQAIALTGTGVGVAKATISPTSLTFASTTVGSSSAAQTIILSNTGSAALGVTSIAITGTNAADFPFTKTCGSSVAAGASCNIVVTFKPTAAGTRTGAVSIVASTGTLTANLTGTAAAKAAASTITLTSTSIMALMTNNMVLTARVASDSGTVPSGTVQLLEGDHLMAQGALSNGVATFGMSDLSGGTHTMHAVYLGNSQVNGSVSNSVTQFVVRRQAPRPIPLLPFEPADSGLEEHTRAR